MRIAFFDPIDWDYTPNSPFERPLGGMQSALCYLMINLAKLGNEIFLLNNIKKEARIQGIHCIPINANIEAMKYILKEINVDVIVVLSIPGLANELKKLLTKHPLFYLWTGHAHNQPCFNGLEKETIRSSWDGFIFVGKWQRDNVCERFGINPKKTIIHRNAIAPAFENLFKPEDNITSFKSEKLILIYNSTPFRGLDILLDEFPKIRNQLNDIELKVFSCMKTYLIEEENDEYCYLYERCRHINGVEYIGSIAQPKLASQLKAASLLAYPNTFHETSCISVMEAMASGCLIISSYLGELPETCAGFGKLINKVPGSLEYRKEFVEEIVSSGRKIINNQNDHLEEVLKKQISFCQTNYTWKVRAKEWHQWLTNEITR